MLTMHTYYDPTRLATAMTLGLPLPEADLPAPTLLSDFDEEMLGAGEFIVIPVADLPATVVRVEKRWKGGPDELMVTCGDGDPRERILYLGLDVDLDIIELDALELLAAARATRAHRAEQERRTGYAETLAVVRKATVPEEMPPVADLVAALRDLGLNVVEG